MKKILTYKYRIFPNKKQEKDLYNHIDLCRNLYNNTLEYKINTYNKTKKGVSKFNIINQLPEIKKEIPEYNSVFSQVLQNVINRVDISYKNFFKKNAKFPKFKGKRHYNSFTYPQKGFNLNNKLFLSKIGEIKIKYHREIKGEIKQLTIRNNNNKWYACFSVLVEKFIQCGNLITGIDLGISQFITFSNGNTINNPKFFKLFENKIKKYQRKVSKTKKGSTKRYKYLKVLNKIHEKLKNKKNDFFHKLANTLISLYKVISLEDLSIKSMLSNNYKNLNKSINEVSWNSFVNILTYKADFSNCKIIKVNPKNTTKKCSNCGNLVEKSLSMRVHSCSCGLEMGRDHNAAINIMRIGLDSLGNLEAQVL